MAEPLVLSEREGLAVAYVLVRRDSASQFAEKFASRFGAQLPPVGHHVETPEITLVWAGADRWLALSTTVSRADWANVLAQAFGDVAGISPQSSGCVVARVAGPRSRDALAKLCPVDLHPSVFGKDAVAMTKLGHVAVQLWRVGEEDTFEIAIPRSYERHVGHELLTAAAEWSAGASSRSG